MEIKDIKGLFIFSRMDNIIYNIMAIITGIITAILLTTNYLI